MKRFSSTLRARMLLSQLLVVVLGAGTLVLMIELLAPSFFQGSVQNLNETMMMDDWMEEDMMSGDWMEKDMMSGDMMMGDWMGGNTTVPPATGGSTAAAPTTGGFLTPSVEEGLQDAFDSSFRRALAVSVAVSALAGMAVSAFSTRRILAPLQAVRQATRKMASGSYGGRVDPPAEAELAALADDVNTLAEALDSTEERRVRLISEVAHELRTPLSTIEGYLEGLLDGMFEPSEEIFAASGREVKRLKRLAEDLSELSRAEEGNQPLNLTRLDLAALASDVAEHLGVQFQAKHVEQVTDTSEVLMVSGDRDRLSQVLTNIIGNALSYTEPGGRVSVTARSDAGAAVIDVNDTGRGLTPEQQTSVFERFYRADHNGPGGTGIGLTIARSITRRHGGQVTATSAGLGHGATFTIRIPLA
jgi:histidine kinase